MTGGGFGLCGRKTRPAGQTDTHPLGAGRGGAPRGGGRGRTWGGGRGIHYRGQNTHPAQAGYGLGPGRSLGQQGAPDSQLDQLRAQANRLEKQLATIQNKINQLESELLDQ
jgi:hypothetical protein